MKTTIRFTFTLIIALWFLSARKTVAQDPEPIWKYAITSSDAELNDLLTDSVGNCYMTGVFRTPYFRFGKDSVPGQEEAETTSMFIMKVTPAGRLIYLYSAYADIAGSNTLPVKLQLNQRGEASLIYTISNANISMFGDLPVVSDPANTTTIVSKISKSGRILWLRQLTCEDTTASAVDVKDLFIDESGDVFLAGYFKGTKAHLEDQTIEGFGNAHSMLFIARIGADGNIIWFRNCPYNAAQDNADIYATIIRNAPGDHFYLGGYHEGYRSFYFGADSLQNAFGPDAFIALYSKNGEAQWARPVKGDSIDMAEDIVVLSNGDPVLMSCSNSYSVNISGDLHTSATGLYNLYLAHYDMGGSCLKSAKIGVEFPSISYSQQNAYLGRDKLDDLIICSNYNATSVFSGAFMLTNSQPGTSDMFFAKLDNTLLTPIWTGQGTATGDNYYEGIHIDATGSIWFSGSTYNNLSVDGETITGNAVEGSPYLVKIKNDGSKDYVYWQMNSADNQLGMQKIANDSYGNAYVFGSYYGNSNVLGTTDMTSIVPQGLYLAKYSRVRDISGFVRNTSEEPVTHAYVKIYGYTYFQRSPLNDSVMVGPDGSFFFANVPFGEYLILAQPLANDAERYVTTYFPSEVYWEYGVRIRVNTDEMLDDLNITIENKMISGGITQMQGNVSSDQAAVKINSGIYDKGRPSKKATVVLAGNKHTKSTWEVVATTETDDNGNFAFYNVEDGTYYLWVDYPGLPVVDAYFVTVSGNQLISSLDYLVNEETVVPAGLPNYNALNDPSAEREVLLYPNPSNGFIYINLGDNPSGIIDFINSEGICVLHTKSESSKSIINVSSLITGNYIVRLVTGNSIRFYKIAIIH